MAIDLGSIVTYADVKKLNDDGLVEYAKLNGVDLPKTDRKDLLSKCASIFLSKKNKDAKITEAPQVELPVSEKPVEVQPAKKKAAKAKKDKSEAKSQESMELSESFDAAKKEGQDFPRCPYCSTAITVDTGVRDGNNQPVCSGCADKVQKSKEKVMKATAKAKKVVEKKAAAKKTVSTKTGRKGNAEALKKARESVAKDDGGFRLGSGASELFQALKKGITLEKAKAIKPNATAYLAAFQMKAGSKSEARSAVIKHDEKTDKYTLKSFIYDGKTIHVK